MNEPHDDEELIDDVVIDHEVYYGVYYQFECGKSFVEICTDMGIDDTHTKISL